jgi:hypothetical protein
MRKEYGLILLVGKPYGTVKIIVRLLQCTDVIFMALQFFTV